MPLYQSRSNIKSATIASIGKFCNADEAMADHNSSDVIQEVMKSMYNWIFFLTMRTGACLQVGSPTPQLQGRFPVQKDRKYNESEFTQSCYIGDSIVF